MLSRHLPVDYSSYKFGASGDLLHNDRTPPSFFLIFTRIPLTQPLLQAPVPIFLPTQLRIVMQISFIVSRFIDPRIPYNLHGYWTFNSYVRTICYRCLLFRPSQSYTTPIYWPFQRHEKDSTKTYTSIHDTNITFWTTPSLKKTTTFQHHYIQAYNHCTQTTKNFIADGDIYHTLLLTDTWSYSSPNADTR